MAPVPKKKTPRGRSNIRRGAKNIKLPKTVKCKNCGKRKFPHRECPHCGQN